MRTAVSRFDVPDMKRLGAGWKTIRKNRAQYRRSVTAIFYEALKVLRKLGFGNCKLRLMSLVEALRRELAGATERDVYSISA